MERRRNRNPRLATPLVAAALAAIAWLALRALLPALGVASAAEREARALAREQLAFVERLSPENLAPTDGFVPPPWIGVPGLGPGEVPVLLGERSAVFAVRWSVSDAEDEGRGGAGASDGSARREVRVRVVWREPGEDAPRATTLGAVVARS